PSHAPPRVARRRAPDYDPPVALRRLAAIRRLYAAQFAIHAPPAPARAAARGWRLRLNQAATASLRPENTIGAPEERRGEDGVGKPVDVWSRIGRAGAHLCNGYAATGAAVPAAPGDDAHRGPAGLRARPVRRAA